MPYITPQSIPADFIVRRVVIPNDVDIIAAVNGALLDLSLPWNWEEVPTGVPVDDVTPLMYTMWLAYMQSTGENVVGQIYPIVTATIPVNCLECDGAQYLRVDYPALYASLDTAFIVDADNFVVPDLRGRTIIGVGTGSSPGATNHPVNSEGGTEEHTLTIAEMPNHAHYYTPAIFDLDFESPGAPDAFAARLGLPVLTDDEGGNGPHNNMQPYTALRYVIIAR